MILRRGMTGVDVALWQRVIGVTPDGIFGAETESATKAWQAQRGLQPDGIVGPKTLAASRPHRQDLIQPAVRAAFVPFSSKLEGVVPWMYLDILGLVTVAIGNLIDPIVHALNMPFVRSDGTPASQQDIRDAWHAVKSRPELAQQGHRVAARYTTIRLTPAGIEQVVWRKAEEMIDHLAKRFTEFPTWPADAQLATLSMAWACGPAFRFPALEKALRAKDFAAAALHCHINETGNPGVIPRNVANKAMYRHAASATDPSVLHHRV